MVYIHVIYIHVQPLLFLHCSCPYTHLDSTAQVHTCINYISIDKCICPESGWGDVISTSPSDDKQVILLPMTIVSYTAFITLFISSTLFSCPLLWYFARYTTHTYTVTTMFVESWNAIYTNRRVRFIVNRTF